MDIFLRLLEAWAGEGKGGWPHYKIFCFQRLLPQLFKVICRPTFNVADANMHKVGLSILIWMPYLPSSPIHQLLGDVANVQYSLFAKYGTEFAQFLATTMLPSLGFPTERVQQYLMALEAKQLAPFLLVSFPIPLALQHTMLTICSFRDVFLVEEQQHDNKDRISFKAKLPTLLFACGGRLWSICCWA